MKQAIFVAVGATPEVAAMKNTTTTSLDLEFTNAWAGSEVGGTFLENKVVTEQGEARVVKKKGKSKSLAAVMMQDKSSMSDDRWWAHDGPTPAENNCYCTYNQAPQMLDCDGCDENGCMNYDKNYGLGGPQKMAGWVVTKVFVQPYKNGRCHLSLPPESNYRCDAMSMGNDNVPFKLDDRGCPVLKAPVHQKQECDNIMMAEFPGQADPGQQGLCRNYFDTGSTFITELCSLDAHQRPTPYNNGAKYPYSDMSDPCPDGSKVVSLSKYR
ncbi:unnamed protein product [Amoebophrya sp. A120]|nr:unnamed protein product [Amoebophrya sp. A120]|eukprot:GSA120T00014494001.1